MYVTCIFTGELFIHFLFEVSLTREEAFSLDGEYAREVEFNYRDSDALKD
jgi:hypothetical protein